MYQLLQQAYSEDAMARTQVCDWFRRFKEGRTSVESDPRSGRQSTLRREEMIAKVRTIFRNNRRLTVREISDDCGISVGSCDVIVTDDLHMKRVCAKCVPPLLTDDQREQRHTIARDLFERSCENVQFLRNIVTGDESWVYGYDPETRQQSSQWKGPTSRRPKNGRQVRSKTKSMSLAFFDSEGIVRHEYAPDGHTINKELCVEILRRLCESVRRKDRKNGGMATGSCTATMRPPPGTHFTSRAAVFGQTRHRSVAVAAILTRSRTAGLFLFPRLKKVLKGHRFEATEDIKRNSTKTPLDIP